MVRYNNGFENGSKKSLNEQVKDIVSSRASRQDKINALVKLGIRENEIQFIMPVYGRVKATPKAKAFKFTFGVEIECVMSRIRFENVASQTGVPYNYEHYNHTDNKEYFKFTTDSSISRSSNREGDPIECVSPILDGTKKGFDKLQLCCKSLNEAGAYVNRSTGLHVHIGARGLTGQQYVNVFKNYQKLEAVIDTFMAESRRNCHWCATLRGYDFSNCYSQRDVYREMNGDRYHKVNPVSYGAHGTIEFRQHQGSTDFKKIKAWVNFCAKLVAYSMDNVLSESITNVDAIPFLTDTEKSFFKTRQQQLANGREAA